MVDLAEISDSRMARLCFRSRASVCEVVPLDLPLRQALLEEVHKVVLGLLRPGRSWDSRNQYGRKQSAIVDIEVGTCRGYTSETVVRQLRVGKDGQEEEVEDEKDAAHGGAGWAAPCGRYTHCSVQSCMVLCSSSCCHYGRGGALRWTEA